MSKQLIKDGLGWGILLWLIGYILGFLFFPIVSSSMIGWVIMPFGIIITLFVLLKKIKNESFLHFAIIAVIWTLIAIVFDYFFLVQILKPADGYYKLDVYLYYALTLLLPLLVGWWKQSVKKKSARSSTTTSALR